MDDAAAEAVRVAERVLDHQFQSFLAGRADLERLMRLGIAALAGTLAGAGLLNQAGFPATTGPLVVVAVGVALQAAATAVASGASIPSELTVGPEPFDLYGNVSEKAPTARDLRIALLQQAALAHDHNLRSLERLVRRRRLVSAVLFSGAGLVLAAMAYVIGGSIHV